MQKRNSYRATQFQTREEESGDLVLRKLSQTLISELYLTMMIALFSVEQVTEL